MAKQGIRLHFNGEHDTVFDFRSPVSGKELLVQKVLLNIATYAKSDRVFPTRGTTLHQDAINGLAINSVEAQHIGNFASLDTELFLAGSGSGEADGVAVTSVTLTPGVYNSQDQRIRYYAQVTFSDATKTPVPVTING